MNTQTEALGHDVSDDAVHDAAHDGFRAVFGHDAEVVASAPGRVNLLGEHTDYNDGHVLPIAITQRTTVAMRRADDGGITLHAHGVGRARFTLNEPPADHFASYVYGCLIEASATGVAVPPSLEVHVQSEVPMGVGLSSSAALEVATLRALRELTGASMDDVRIAQLAQLAEIEHAGVRCGIMDQMASSLCDTQRALWLDTRTLERRLVPLPRGAAVLVLDSGISRQLATSGYNERRAECEEAARLLGVRSLRDIDDPSTADGLPEPLRRRVKHVVTENARVLLAVTTSDARAFGLLMNASHDSLRDDYEVSVPPLDQLVELLRRSPFVFGARLTGAGFGGACVALCEENAVLRVTQDVLADYASLGHAGRLLVPPQA
jgi:galactokinase